MKKLYNDIINGKEKIAIMGLGYVGLPQAIAFSKKVKTIAYDINKDIIRDYLQGDNIYGISKEEMLNPKIEFTYDEKKLQEAGLIIVAVPTPINNDKTPDLYAVKEASTVIGENLRKGTVVVYESTVYPGVTEEVCIPILEVESGLQIGKDFKVGYSPERINPGDENNSLENIVKLVSAIDDETRDFIASIYQLIIKAGTHEVSSIRVAEAAKLVENAQRDINIAFMNELAMVFEKMEIHTKEVIDAMNTKWNSLGFTPGLVGGHCISVDPYYFLYEAEKLGYHSQIILAGRKINDSIPEFITNNIIKELIKADKDIRKSKIYMMGITFKENCGDLRNSKVIDIINQLKDLGIEITLVDPVADADEVRKLTGIELVELSDVKEADCLVFAVAHKEFKDLKLGNLLEMYKNMDNRKKILIDIKNVFIKKDVEEKGISYWSL